MWSRSYDLALQIRYARKDKISVAERRDVRGCKLFNASMIQ